MEACQWSSTKLTQTKQSETTLSKLNTLKQNEAKLTMERAKEAQLKTKQNEAKLR